MCGIIGYVGKKAASPILLEGLRRLEYRGYDSAGVVVLDGADLVVRKFEHNAMMHPWAWLPSRALARKAGPWDESLSLDDDGESFTRVVLASPGVRCCPV